MSYIGKTPTAVPLTSSDITDGIITTAKIVDANITTAKILDSNVTTAKIADDAVTADKLANSINSAITANTAKTGITSSQASAITANTAKVTNATHSGEVTGATALTIANNIVDEANLKVSNSPTNGYVLSAQSGNTGGLTWVETSSGAMTLIKSVTAAGGAYVEFKNGASGVVIDSTYSTYKIIGFNITPQTDDRNIQIQFSTDAGSSYITSGYYTMTQRNIDGTINTGLTTTGSAMDLNNVGNSTNEEGAFEFTVFNPSSASHFTHYQSMATTRNNGAAVVFYQSGGIYEATSDIDAFKVFFNTGNISGTFKLYGIT